MTQVAIVQTELTDDAAGELLGREVVAGLGGRPDAVIVFASPKNEYHSLLKALARTTGTTTIVGCSTAGEFTGDESGQGLTNVTAIRSETMRFSASVGEALADDASGAARQLVAGFSGGDLEAFPFRAALVLVDALAGHAEELIDSLTLHTAGTYRFFGGGAGDDARFKKTHVFRGSAVFTNAAVALEIVSRRPVGIGARHGWVPGSRPLRVTAADAVRVDSFNAAPAVEAFDEYAQETTQAFDRSEPMPFFLHNVVGVGTQQGHKLRVPLGISENGGILFAADVPTGASACIMSTEGGSAAAAAAAATRDAVAQVKRTGGTPRAALFFDCVATRLRLGREFEKELDAVSSELGDVPFAGFNSYGQIVRSDGQFSGFHNCTAVVCVLPD